MGERWPCGVVLLLLLLSLPRFAQPQSVPPLAGGPALVLEWAGVAEVSRGGLDVWDPAYTNQVLNAVDRLRTGERSRATIRLSEQSLIRMGELSLIQIPRTSKTPLGLQLFKGIFYFFHRDKPGQFDVQTPGFSALIRGTEFIIQVEADGTSTVELLDGEVEMSNEFGPPLRLHSGEAGTAKPGNPPVRTAVVEATQAIQWWLYYPAVLDTDELDLNDEERRELEASLKAYRNGDLLAALAQYPAGRQPQSNAERIYLAALLLSVGQIGKAEELTRSVPPSAVRLANALHRVVAAVKGERMPTAEPFQTASEWVAESYYQQSKFKLSAALEAARQAVGRSPNFGFAWARVAELEFSFGRSDAALEALEKSLRLSPRNPQASALKGFLLTARNRFVEARTAFDEAIAIDGALGNAWLGRGLLKIRQGDAEGGRQDLQTAAVVEPNRSLLRSYLGKAYAHETLFTRDARVRAELRARARAELELAKVRDPLDPTPWLYSALLDHDEYRAADAIRELEESARRNDNRQIYRSRLLLDQDRAVQSANLANVFDDASMNEVSVRESARAVSFDYGNFSAHLNLASSFNSLRDPTRFNLRYESEWFNEHLLSSLLAPVGAGSLSQNLSQQEYSRLFAGDRFGFTSTSEYFSNGEYRQLASQFGSYRGLSYALDLDYQHKNGVRPNNDLERIEWYSRIKGQITPEDSLLFLVKYQDYDAGDNFQYYDPSVARPNFRFTETQAPLLLAGLHHEWTPGMHTLFLGGRLQNDQNASDLDTAQLAVFVNPPAGTFVPAPPFDVAYHSGFETYSAELQQIAQRERDTDIVGIRYQNGSIQARSVLDNQFPLFYPVPLVTTTDSDFERISAYLYHHWKLGDDLVLIGGVAYDRMTFPENFRRPPLSDRDTTRDQISPKAAAIWNLRTNLTLRGVYAEALGGVSYDESVRLEPTQLAGFGQSFRSVISESLVGSIEAPHYRVGGLAVDCRPGPQTWLGLQGQWTRAEVDREIGVLFFDSALFPAPPAFNGSTREQLDYDQWSATAAINQILGREWFLEARYQFTQSELKAAYPTIPLPPGASIDSSRRADLHEGRLSATWRHPCGFFARTELWWFAQQLDGSVPQPRGDSFPQLNLYAGYRFPNRHGEITLGLLNATGDDYRLSPLNYYLELPRERLFYTRLRINF